MMNWKERRSMSGDDMSLKSVRVEKTIYVCDFCGKEFKVKKKYDEHVKTCEELLKSDNAFIEKAKEDIGKHYGFCYESSDHRCKQIELCTVKDVYRVNPFSNRDNPFVVYYSFSSFTIYYSHDHYSIDMKDRVWSANGYFDRTEYCLLNPPQDDYVTHTHTHTHAK